MVVKKATKITFIIISTLVLLYFSINLIMLLTIRRQEEVDVPDLTGLTMPEAYERLTALHLFMVKEGEQHNSSILQGSIISQVPLAGSRVKAGRRVKVILSLGSEKVMIPNVQGKPCREAEIVVRQVGLIVTETVRIYSSVEVDTVVLQEPGAGIEVEKGMPVNLVVSAGVIGPNATMPNLLSRSYIQAEKYVKIMGLKIQSVTTEVNDNIDSGTVLAQFPQSNSPITTDTLVSFVISVKSGEENTSSSVKMLHYEVAQGLFEKRVRIVVVDEAGEKEVYNAARSPGSKIDLAVTIQGKARAKIFVNEVLVEEREL